MARRVDLEEGHCLSLALTTKRTSVFPLAVALARLWVPVSA